MEELLKNSSNDLRVLNDDLFLYDKNLIVKNPVNTCFCKNTKSCEIFKQFFCSIFAVFKFSLIFFKDSDRIYMLQTKLSQQI